MKTFRIYGDLLSKHYLDVEAESLEEAYTLAAQAERHRWNQIEIDNNIDPYDYEELIVTSTGHEYRGEIVEL
jgi:hypothetical protein